MKLVEPIHSARAFVHELLRRSTFEEAGWNGPRRSFVASAVLALLAAGSTVLAELVRRMVSHGVALRHRYKNVDRMLGEVELRPVAAEQMAMFGAEVGLDWVIAFDPSDIAKRHGRKMECLAAVHDGSEGRELVPGYRLLTASAFPLRYKDRSVPLPLLFEVESSTSAEFVSEPATTLDALSRLCAATKAGTIVIDREADNRRVFDCLLDRKRRFVIRVKAGRGSRSVVLIDQKRKAIVADAWKEMTSFGEMSVERLKQDGRTKAYRCEYGSIAVRLPDRNERLWLCVFDSPDHKQPMVVLTNHRADTARACQRALEFYFARWTEEEMHRWAKQSFGVEEVRLLTWHRLQNMIALVWIAMGVIARQARITDCPARRVELCQMRARKVRHKVMFVGYLFADEWRERMRRTEGFLASLLRPWIPPEPDPQLSLVAPTRA